jgi:hypothetical protein
MDFQKIALKIAYWLVAVCILVIIALTFYGRHIVQKESKKAITVKEAWDTDTKITFSDMSITLDDSITKKTSPKAEDTPEKSESEKAAQNR